MIVQGLVFYGFSAMLLLGGVMVISARNPVHSVLWLIFAFFQAAGLFVLLGAEFLATTLVVVYVGAVAVLFLFVVMMLDINFARLREGFLSYLPIGALIGLVLAAELLAAVGGLQGLAPAAVMPTPSPIQVHNTLALGRLIYTHYVYLFQGAGVVLFIAMIGAIVLTLRHAPGVRRQSIPDQVQRTREASMAIRQVPTRGGL